jgi:L-serine deaminase
MGVSSLFASCDDTVGITYGYDAAYKINSVTVTGIADACKNKPISVSIANVTTPGSPIVGSSVSMAAWATTAVDNNSFSFPIATPTVPLSSDLGAATVIIG